jgi:hypothetical protein
MTVTPLPPKQFRTIPPDPNNPALRRLGYQPNSFPGPQVSLEIGHGFGNTKTMAKKRRKKRRPGRPATGRDPSIPVRLPKKFLADIDAWAAVYRNEHELVMTRSTAIRCLILLGLESARRRAVDPKTKLTYEGETPALLRFYRHRTVTRWLV